MKRDMEVIRKMVLAVADAELGEPVARIEGINAQVFAAHAQLLVEAGLIMAALQGADRDHPDRPIKTIPKAAVIYRLTWAGQDFASAIRDETLWNKAVKNVIKPTASWTFGILKAYLQAEIKDMLPGLSQ